MTPSGLRGVVNDAVAIYLLDPASAAGFVARWCTSNKVEIAGGAFRVGEDAPEPRIGAALHGVFQHQGRISLSIDLNPLLLLGRTGIVGGSPTGIPPQIPIRKQ